MRDQPNGRRCLVVATRSASIVRRHLPRTCLRGDAFGRLIEAIGHLDSQRQRWHESLMTRLDRHAGLVPTWTPTSMPNLAARSRLWSPCGHRHGSIHATANRRGRHRSPWQAHMHVCIRAWLPGCWSRGPAHGWAVMCVIFDARAAQCGLKPDLYILKPSCLRARAVSNWRERREDLPAGLPPKKRAACHTFPKWFALRFTRRVRGDQRR